MSLAGITLLIVAVLLVIGSIPVYPWNREWGPAPAGFLTVLLILVLITVLAGYF